MRSEWYVEAYQTGQETAQQAATTGEWFLAFSPALARLRELKLAGATIVRVMGPSSASDEQHAAIVAEGGSPTFT